jgi:hypothetical protein
MDVGFKLMFLVSWCLPGLWVSDKRAAPVDAALGLGPILEFLGFRCALWVPLFWNRESSFHRSRAGWRFDVIKLSNSSGCDILTRTLDPYNHPSQKPHM